MPETTVPRIVVIRQDLITQQLCVHKDVSDEDVKTWLDKPHNWPVPYDSESSLRWEVVDNDIMEQAGERQRVQCDDHPDRCHVIVGC